MKLKIKQFKRWLQVQRDGYTVAQFLSRKAAEEFVRDASPFPCNQMGYETVNQRIGRVTGHLIIYP